MWVRGGLSALWGGLGFGGNERYTTVTQSRQEASAPLLLLLHYSSRALRLMADFAFVAYALLIS
jgi:hypothetical protein